MKKTFGTIMLVAALAAGLYSCSTLSGAGSSGSSGSGAGSSVSSGSVAQPYTGDGGKGQSVAVLVPEGRGLGADEAYLPTLVQGVFVGDFSKYSAMSILDRQNLEKVLSESESGIYTAGADFIELGKITKTSLLLSGSVTKTKTAYTFSIAVTDTQSGQTKAAYNGSCTIAEFDDFSGIRKASAELLAQMGVQLTDAARAELSGAAAAQNVKAQTALAQGITAQKRGTEVESLMYYNMAAAFDPSLLEAQKRVSVTAASISSGNIGEDARNDIKWHNDWKTRLTEFEQFLDNYLKTNPPQYEFLYSTALESGKIDYQKETLDMTLYARLIFADFGYFEALDKTIETVKQGLEATGRAKDWGLSARVPEGTRSNQFEIVIDILNDKGSVIGSAKQTVMGSYNLSGGWGWGTGIGAVIGSIYIKTGAKKGADAEEELTSLYAYTVNVNDITDRLTVRITSVNGANPASAKNLTITEYKGEVGREQYGYRYFGGGGIKWGFVIFDGGGKIALRGQAEGMFEVRMIIPDGQVWGKNISLAPAYSFTVGQTRYWDKVGILRAFKEFPAFYDRNGKKAGAYAYRNGWWESTEKGY